MVARIAQRLPLEHAELEGILAALVMRAAQPDNATKLHMALDLQPKTRRAANSEFLVALGQMDDALLARGRAVLDAMSDEEWDALLEDDEEPEAGGVSGA